MNKQLTYRQRLALHVGRKQTHKPAFFPYGATVSIGGASWLRK